MTKAYSLDIIGIIEMSRILNSLMTKKEKNNNYKKDNKKNECNDFGEYPKHFDRKPDRKCDNF